MPLAQVAGRKLYHEVHGEAEGTPLVLVTGMAGSCRGWLALQVPEFAPRHRTLIFDHRGVGESEDAPGSFSTADLADDLAGLLDAVGFDRVHLLGSFLGGMVAQEFALRHPDRLERLVLAGTWARPDAKRRMLLEKWKLQARAGTAADVFVKERLLWTLADETLEQRDLVAAMSESFPGDGLPISADLFVRQADAALAHDTLDRLHRVSHHVLLLCGRQDQLTPPRLHREMADELPRGRLVTLSYGAHLILAESARRFNQTTLAFLAGD